MNAQLHKEPLSRPLPTHSSGMLARVRGNARDRSRCRGVYGRASEQNRAGESATASGVQRVFLSCNVFATFPEQWDGTVELRRLKDRLLVSRDPPRSGGYELRFTRFGSGLEVGEGEGVNCFLWCAKSLLCGAG